MSQSLGDERVVKLLGELLALLVEIALKAQRKSDARVMVRHEALRRVDRDGDDLLGGVVRDFLDVHAAFGRGDHGNAARRTVHQHGEVIFALDIDTVGHIEAIDLLTRFASLHRHQRVAEHFLRVASTSSSALGEPHAAFGILGQFLELALAASTGMDLRLHHVKRPGQLLGAFDGFFNRQRRIAVGHGDTVLFEQFLGLVFMDVHGSLIPLLCEPGCRRAGNAAKQTGERFRRMRLSTSRST
jgi:hypothetical protein